MLPGHPAVAGRLAQNIYPGILLLTLEKTKKNMKKITMYLGAAVLCFFLACDRSPLMAQDASHPAAANDDNDSSDWGLLGLLGLVGLLGLKKKEPVADVNLERRTSTSSGSSPTGPR
jgi:hypothetical protein